jgi:uncharacterized protein YlxW (UPF0749 family)
MSGVATRMRSIPVWEITLFLALVSLGFLIAAQVRSETPRVRYTSQERAPLIETALGLQTQQNALQAQILDLRSRIASAEVATQGSSAIATQLNDALFQARLAAGLTALDGNGLVVQLEDAPQVSQAAGNADLLVTGRDVRTTVEELWLAGAEAVAVNDERVVAATSIIDIGGSLLVNSAYVAPPYQVNAVGPADMYTQLAASASWVEFVTSRAGQNGIRIAIAQPSSLIVPAYAGSVSIRYAQPPASAAPAAQPQMRPPRSPISHAAVALVLGFLVVTQVRSQSGGTGLEDRSAQDLTLLVANLNTRNDQLRGEVADLGRQLDSIVAAQARGDTSAGQLRADLVHVRIWAGVDPAVGQGVRVMLRGPVTAVVIEDLVNELRNAGAEAIAVGGVRIVPATIAGGLPGSLSVENTPLSDPVEVDAIGSSATMTGTLTRAGGLVAQEMATNDGLAIEVTPVDQLAVPATTRDLVPRVAKPRL